MTPTPEEAQRIQAIHDAAWARHVARNPEAGRGPKPPAPVPQHPRRPAGPARRP